MRTELRRAAGRARDDAVRRFERLPVRVRLMASFAGVMVVLFGVIALLVYFIFEAGLDTSLNNSLKSRADTLALVITPSHHPGLKSTNLDFALIQVARTGAVRAGQTPFPRPEPFRIGLSNHAGYRVLVEPIRREGWSGPLSRPAAYRTSARRSGGSGGMSL